MEDALSFLKATACTTHAAKACLSSESEAEEDGPYFDLEFSARKNDKNALTESTTTMSSDVEHDDDDDSISDQEAEEAELKFECTDENEEENAASDNELFFKGNLVSIQPSSDDVPVNGASEVINGSKVPVFLLKLLLKLKKSKTSNEKLCDEKINEAAHNDVADEESENTTNKGGSGNKFFTVKFNVHEVPLMSLFTRDSSSKEKLTRQESSYSNESSTHQLSSSDEKNKQQQIAKEVQKYLKMVKPFYVRVSKRYAEKLKGSKCGAPTTSPPRAAEESGKGGGGGLKQGINVGNLPAGLRLVRKRLGKSRSASASVEEVAAVVPAPAPGNRRDDSLLQVQDGIQGAIMHCKRSFNASQDAQSSLMS